ncbi:MAG: hypothetical protein ACOX3W_07770 [Christensenellaceae bacterium]|jgi:hypothetical protein
MYLLQHTGGGFGGRDVILTNMGSAQVKVMLLTELSKILMRSASVMSEYEAFSNVSSKLYDKNPLINETIEQVSKMIQYQSIKQPGEPVDHIFLFGEYASPKV